MSEKENLKKAILEAMEAPFTGWDFSYTDQFGGKPESSPPWDYQKALDQQLKKAESLLDIDTGGGEFIGSFHHLPRDRFATESYQPNIEIARQRLESIGFTVMGIEEGIQENRPLPFIENRFDLIINTHGCYEANEIFRVLKPGGVFITKQVGCQNSERLKTLFGSLTMNSTSGNSFEWKLETAALHLKEAGFHLTRHEESIGTQRYFDIRTVVYYLKALTFDFPFFDPWDSLRRLENITFLIRRDGYFEDLCHRFFIMAQKRG